MRPVKRLLLGLLLTLLLLVAGGWLRLLTSLPKPDRIRAINGLLKIVEIRRDPNGVPRIKAQTEHNSYVALSYVHAQDRLWQMDFLRQLGPGRLSKILGHPTCSQIAICERWISTGSRKPPSRTCQPHQPANPMTPEANTFAPQLACHLARTVIRILQKQLVDPARQRQVRRALSP